MRVAVLGASPKPDRYSHKAVALLKERGHDVVPVNPGHKQILGLNCASSLADLPPESVHTITVYVNAGRSNDLSDALLALKPHRVIFNPGAENPELAGKLKQAGVEVRENCTLVMLRSGQF